MTRAQERWLAAFAVIVGVLLVIGLLIASLKPRKVRT